MSLMKKLGTAVLAGSLAAGGNAVAQDTDFSENAGLDFRLRTDYIGNVDDFNIFETDFGIANNGTYDGNRIGVLGAQVLGAD